MVILTTFPPPTEGIKVLQPNTMAHVGSKNCGKGTLYIAESRLSWVGDTGPGFSLEYPAISMHAVSRDLSAYPHECLYLMIDGNLGEAGMDPDVALVDPDDGDEESDNISEIRFVPDDKDILQAMYHAMTECQSLHPDQEDISEEDDDWNGAGDEEEEDEEDGDDFSVETTPNGLRVARGNGAGGGDDDQAMETGQFEDADS